MITGFQQKDGIPVQLIGAHRGSSQKVPAAGAGEALHAGLDPADFGRFAQIPAGHSFRFKAVSVSEAQAAAREFAELLRTLPDRLRGIENFDLNIEALRDANVAGSAVSAVDAGTWQSSSA